jgi:hydrogenase nickel incorporation protein HypB
MCENCGCSTLHEAEAGHDPGHAHPHAHDHAHPHTHDDDGRPIPAAATTRLTLEQRILSRNDEFAAHNRAWLAECGVCALNLISAPGSGKTRLLERTLDRLCGRIPCAVITGDLQTDRDAKRLEGRGAIVRQIETVSACHLNAQQVGDLLPEVTADGARLLFIENVGNMVCPAAFDLGESFKVALLSTTEGEDKPLKYPALFSQAPVVLLTKVDLLPHLEWDIARCRDYIRRIHPGVFLFELSAKSGQGMDAWIAYLESLVR